MLIKKGNRFELYPHKVKYIQHGKEIEQWALPNKEWWIDFADKWEHTEIIEFTEVELTEEQQARVTEIEELPMSEAFRGICIDYILNGVFPEGINHPLRDLQIQKENQEQGIDLSEREIQEIIQGQQMSDLDIRVLMLELGGN